MFLLLNFLQSIVAGLSLRCDLQDATHVMVQRSLQMESDLDETAALLCQEMQDTADRDVTIRQLQAQIATERKHHLLAMAAVSSLSVQVQMRDQELGAAADQRAKIKANILSHYAMAMWCIQIQYCCPVIILLSCCTPSPILDVCSFH